MFHVYQVNGSTSRSLPTRKGVTITFGSLLKWTSKAPQLTLVFSAQHLSLAEAHHKAANMCPQPGDGQVFIELHLFGFLSESWFHFNF